MGRRGARTAGLCELLGNLYDAAIDASLWAGSLEAICRYVDAGAVAAILTQDLIARTGIQHAQWEHDPRFSELYFSRYIQINPTLEHLAALRAGQMIHFGAPPVFEDLRASRFRDEWARPQDFSNAIMAVLTRDGPLCTALSITLRGRRQAFHPQAEARIGSLVPHLRRALTISRLLETETRRTATLSGFVDELTAAVYVVSAENEVLYANPSGTSLRAQGHLFHRSHLRLTCIDAAAQRALQSMLAACGSGVRNSYESAQALPVEARDSRCYILHVLPLSLTSSHWRLANPNSAAAVLFVSSVGVTRSASTDLLARLHRLTPMESKVLGAIVCEEGVPAASRLLGIAETTVKTHLRHIFQKTGTDRQSELVKLAASAASPFKKP